MYVAIDVGGTSINVGLFEDLTPDSRISTQVIRVKNDYEQDMKSIKTTLANWNINKVKGIGIGLPGLLNNEETKIINSENLSSWNGKNVVQELSEDYLCDQVYASNDVKAATISEVLFNNKNDEFVFIIWGTGIGATKVTVQDKIPRFHQIELGYQRIYNSVMIDNVEKPGYLEYLVGGGYLKNRFKKLPHDMTDEQWSLVFDDFSIGIINMMMLNYTDSFVIGGGTFMKQSHRLELLKSRIKHNIPFYDVPKIECAKFGEDAGVIGALGLIKLKSDIST